MTAEEIQSLIYKAKLRSNQIEDAKKFLAERGSNMAPEEFLKQLNIGIPRTAHNEAWWFNHHKH